MQTWRTIQQEIKDLVDNENKVAPLSDEEIAEDLSQEGKPGCAADGHEVSKGPGNTVEPQAEVVLRQYCAGRGFFV